jgi:hypothetical protein
MRALMREHVLDPAGFEASFGWDACDDAPGAIASLAKIARNDDVKKSA